MKYTRHIGRFRLRLTTVEQVGPDAMLELFGQMIIQHGKFRPEHKANDFIAVCNRFKAVPEDANPPWYDVRWQNGAWAITPSEMSILA